MNRMKNYKMFLLQLGVLLLSSFSSLYPHVFKNAKETSLVKRIPIGFSWWAPADDDWRSSLTGLAGARPMYAFEFHSFEPKYGGKKTVTQRGAALFCTLGYNFQMRDKLSLFIEFEYEHFITEGLINVIVPTAGISLGL